MLKKSNIPGIIMLNEILLERKNLEKINKSNVAKKINKTSSLNPNPPILKIGDIILNSIKKAKVFLINEYVKKEFNYIIV
ncbi:MAG: hypothetical protein CMD04_01880 [Flavobacteriales bacterium]|nr:hypothetical protein [Flavobacteriales bacterium]|tara:strand:- start:80 stop:319 length:240 start_codon:yes stop_codon:yes gene_type:complete